MRETRIERQSRFNQLHVFLELGDLECIDVRHQVVDLSSTDNQEDMRGLLHEVCDSDGRDVLRSCLLRNLLENGTHFLLVLAEHPID